MDTIADAWNKRWPQTGYYEGWEERWAWDGYRPSRAAVCPLVVLGRRCRIGMPSGEDCICQRYDRLFDHAAVWIDRDGRKVYTAEPYDVGGDELADALAELHELGLQVYVTGLGRWHPSTFVLKVHAD
jgi:hypothetical protein